MTEISLPQKGGTTFKIDESVLGVTKKRYEVGERLGSGGNAVVHKCFDRISGEEYAIKFQLMLRGKRKERFENELKLLKSVRSDQLLKYIDEGTALGHLVIRNTMKPQSNRIPFVILSLADGNLTDYMRENNFNIRYEEYIGQFRGLAKALSDLHQHAIHRDIKPENILIKGDTWFLGDFGLCKLDDAQEDLTYDGEIVGPRFWPSPELSDLAMGKGSSISKASDVFQLCSVFWFVVTGRHPTGWVCKDDWKEERDSIFEVIYNAISHNPIRRPQNGGELYDLLNKAIVG